jgi:glycosyltransferase involved in cell wall biosynthesis
MKLIFVAPGTVEIPVERYGGIERVVWNLAQGFLDANYTVKILAKRNANYLDSNGLIHDPYETSKVNMANEIDFSLGLTHHPEQYLRGIFNYLEENLRDDDVVFLNHSEQKDIRRYLEHRGVKFFEIGHYRNFSGDTKIVFPSTLIKRMFFQKSGCVIPHPTDYNEFFNVDEAPIVKGKYLLCVGRVCRNKRTKIALRIANELGVQCVIAGPIHDEAYAKTFIDQCVYLGDCDSTQLRNLYSNAIVSVCLTNILPPETFGLFQVEAQACGSIVISSKTGGLADTFNNKYCIEYNSLFGVKSVVKKFKEMMGSKDRLSPEEISNDSRKRYSIQSVVKSYISKLELTK